MTSSAPEPPSGPFELSGGALCLDLANTWGDRGRPETESLGSYAALLVFSRQAGILEEPESGRLAARAARSPRAAREAHAAAIELRDCLYRIFAAAARRRSIGSTELAHLATALRESFEHLRLERRDNRFSWGFEEGADSLRAPLWRISRSAAELLTSDELGRVRECDGATCTWLFLDRSRGRSRRWCSMESCGNRAKARRHYQRQRPVEERSRP